MRRVRNRLLMWVTAGMVLTVLAPAVAGASAIKGSAVITKPGQSVPLDSGGSGTTYGVWLPADAKCSGDTQHSQYHTFSFMFPANVDPADVSFKTGEPAGLGTNGRLGFIADGQYVGALNTAPTTGQVIGLPESFTWTRLNPTYLLLTNGRDKSTWEGGILCANKFGVVTNYWESEIVFTASKPDPRGFTWYVPKSAQTVIATSHSFPIGVVLLIVAAVLVVVAVVMGRRRKGATDNAAT